MIDRTEPCNVDAEEGVIGSLLIDGSSISLVTGRLEPGDFFTDPCRMLYEACLALHGGGVAIDQITIVDELGRAGKLSDCGGAAFLSHLIANTPTSLDLEPYADIVKRDSTRRKLIRAAKDIEASAYEGKGDVDEMLRNADDRLLNLRKTAGSVSVITPEDRVALQSDRYARAAAEAKRLAVDLGFIDLDRELGGGAFPGDLIIAGGRPGMGKTTFCQEIANHVSARIPVLLCTGRNGRG